MKVALIPARGGSKRVPRKNIRSFAGLPMIAHSIRTAFAAKCFDRVVVSTDDAEIAEVARKFGAEVPFTRPPELADDHATTMDVIVHALSELRAQGAAIELLCCIYATAPFIRAEDLARGLEMVRHDGVDYAFSVTSFSFPVQRALFLDANGHVSMAYPQYLNVRSQDLPPAFHDAGQFYWGKPAAFEKRQPIFSERAVGVVLPHYRVQDIDTEEDWQRAELIWHALAEREPVGGSS